MSEKLNQFNNEDDKSYTKQEAAEIIARARMTHMRLISVIPNARENFSDSLQDSIKKEKISPYQGTSLNYDKNISQVSKTIEKMLILLTVSVAIVGFMAVLSVSPESQSPLNHFIVENRGIILTLSAGIIISIIVFFLYNNHKLEQRHIFLKQANELAKRLEYLLEKIDRY